MYDGPSTSASTIELLPITLATAEGTRRAQEIEWRLRYPANVTAVQATPVRNCRSHSYLAFVLRLVSTNKQELFSQLQHRFTIVAPSPCLPPSTLA
jgi:hypothetical protein